MKTHYYSEHVLKNAPDYIVNQYKAEEREGSLCGFLRKNVTIHTSNVTCKLCLHELKKRGEL